jgi:cation diffusion facilitator CzcD-associated flavoprotein CzcO
MNGTKETAYSFQDRPVDEGRRVDVTIIGAGVSGLALYIKILQHVPEARVTIFEKNPECGGTWYENRYPGVACDIPSHVYQYTFEPHTQWSKFFAPGAEILSYVQGVAQKYGFEEKIKYNTKVIGATWNETEGRWHIKTERNSDGCEPVVDESSADVVISAVGLLNNWKWPTIEGLKDFEGVLLHSANWDSSW